VQIAHKIVAKKLLSESLRHMAKIAKRSNLLNLTQGLLDAADDVKALEWEITVLKQGRIRRKMASTSTRGLLK